ncbi:MAG: SO_0444 family Cu/Zn efflux transporter [candidate division Zixibacteria bacterium]|nr:SO_0444 family Cu/Zn efflux transporter [candidate division Zixibacteria bacterium]
MFVFIQEIWTQSWLLLGQMAPYLLFGFLAAGILSIMISAQWVQRNLGKPGLGSVLRASLFGVPLPLCSCSVLPVSVSMRRSGASNSATTAFLLSTPQTGVDSIAVTYALLGPFFAVFRPLTAFFTGLMGGALVHLFGESGIVKEVEKPDTTACDDACCSDEKNKSYLKRILHYAFVVLPKDIALALLVGVLIAGVMAVLVPQDYLGAYIGGGVISILIMIAAGVPVYVCATASVPIAAGFIYMGGSPGAALAFLIAGPATNTASFVTIWKTLGGRNASIYLLTVGVSALGFGLLLDWLIPLAAISLPALENQAHVHSEGGWFYNTSAIILLLVFLYSYLSGIVSIRKTKARKVEMSASGLNEVDSTSEAGCCCHCADSGGHNTQENGDI